MSKLTIKDKGHADKLHLLTVASGMSEVIGYKLMVPGLEMTLMVSEVNHAVRA